MSEELVRFGRTTAVFAFGVKSLDSGRVPCMVDGMDWELGKVTLIELLGCALFKHFTSAFLQ